MKAKSAELDAMIKKAPEGWDSQKAQRLIGEIRITNERIADVGKSNFQRKLGVEHRVSETKSKVEELRRKYMIDPSLREINLKFMRKHTPEAVLRCYKCGEPDHGNRMNGKPWCFKCKIPLSRESDGNPKQSSMKSLERKHSEWFEETFRPLEA